MSRRVPWAVVWIPAIIGLGVPLVLSGLSLRPPLGVPPVSMLVLCTLMAVLCGMGLAILNAVPLRSNLVFYIVYTEGLIYLFIAPSVFAATMIADDRDLLNMYALIELFAFFLFIIPLAIIYWIYVCSSIRSTRPHLRVDVTKLSILLIASCVFSVIYLVALSSYGLLFRRIGWESLAMAYIDLPQWAFAVIRIFDRTGLPLICLLVVAMVHVSNWFWQLATALTLVAVGGAYLFVSAMNSRLSVLQAIVVTFVVMAYWGWRSRRSTARMMLYAILATMLGLWGIKVALNVRTAFEFEGIRPEHFNPFSSASAALIAETSYAERLNCVDLMARITPEAIDRGYPLGSAWWPTVIVTLGGIVAPDLVQEYKMSLTTSAKHVLLREYAGLQLPDYPSCALTDIYGNLGPLGMLIAAVVFAWLIILTTRWLSRPHAGWQLVVSLVLLQALTVFEADFSAIVLGMVPLAPTFAILLLLNPIVAVPQAANEDNAAVSEGVRQ